jgi:ZIP family zinc transporter/zinc and cadmium transporter
MTALSDTLLFSGLAAGADLMGGAVVIARKEWDARVLDGMLALGSGFMLAAALLDIIPASLAGGPVWLPGLVLAGFLFVQVTENCLAPHVHLSPVPAHDHGHRHGTVCSSLRLRPKVGLSALMGFLVHTFFDGVAIGAGFSVSSSLGMLIFLAVIMHKVPEGITLASIILACGGGRRLAFASATVLGLATIVGALLTGTLAVVQEHYALAFSGGVTLYVAAADLVPEVRATQGRRGSLLIGIGVGLFWITNHYLEAAGLH